MNDVRSDGSVAALAARRTGLLTTYRRDGTPVDTPVTIAVEDGHVFFRTYDRAWKARRLRRNPEVLVRPCTVRGKPRGAAVRARARLLEGEEARCAARAIARRQRVLQGLIVPLGHRLMRYRTLHYELLPAGVLRRPAAPTAARQPRAA
jgi:hypothetical protein